MLTPSATTIKLYLLMQVSIAQQGGDHMYYKHTHTLTKKTDNLYQTATFIVESPKNHLKMGFHRNIAI